VDTFRGKSRRKSLNSPNVIEWGCDEDVRYVMNSSSVLGDMMMPGDEESVTSSFFD
jgi:hypothetical protein